MLLMTKRERRTVKVKRCKRVCVREGHTHAYIGLV